MNRSGASKSLRCVLGIHQWEWSDDYDRGRVCRCVRCGENGEAQSESTAAAVTAAEELAEENAPQGSPAHDDEEASP